MEDVENIKNRKFHVLRKGLFFGRAHFNQIEGVPWESPVHPLPYSISLWAANHSAVKTPLAMAVSAGGSAMRVVEGKGVPIKTLGG
jgi:hypothetical protein